MNKKIYNEDLTLNLIINGEKMRQGNKVLLHELHQLDQATRKMQIEVARLTLEKRGLDKADATQARRLKEIDVELKQLNKNIELNQQAMMNMRKEIGLAGLTINQLRTHLKVLQTQLHNATDPKTARRLRKEIEEVNFHVTRLSTGAGRLSQAWTRLAQKANRFAAVIGFGTGVVFGLGMAVGKVIDRLTGLDRKLSEVMKTTELSREEARRLKGIFDDMGTPTKTDDLLDMAHIAGRLGLRGVEDIAAFTRSVDILNVALGKDLNLSVEETAEKVGKLVNAFRVKDRMPIDEALLRTGSLLNELDKKSEASSGTILEYLTRLSSLGTSAKYSMEDLAGLAATLEMVNIPAERGSTALRKLITGLGKYTEEFSRMLGVSVDEYKRMVDEDINGVFLKLMELSANGNGSVVDLVESMGDMEVSGVRVAEVYGALVMNLDRVREQQGYATTAFQSSASVMEEYAIMSGDFAAAIALQGKRVRALSDDYQHRLRPAAYELYKGWVDFLYLLKDLGKWLADHSGLIKGLAALYVVWKATAIATWLKEAAFALKFYTYSVYANIKAQIKQNEVFIATQRHGVKGMIGALKQLWAVMAANPIALVIGLVSAAAAAIFLFQKKVDPVVKLMGDFSTAMSTEKDKMNSLFEAVKKTAEGTEARANGIKTINTLYGEYLPALLDEKTAISDIAIAQAEANRKLEEHIALKWQNEAFEEFASENAKERAKKAERLLPRAFREKVGSGAYGQALFELQELSGKVLNEKGEIEKAGQVLVKEFLDKWDLNNTSSREAIKDYFDLYSEQRKAELELDKLVQGYLTAGKQSGGGGGSTGSIITGAPLMSEDDFNAEKKALELIYNKQVLLLKNSNIEKEKLRMEELVAQAAHYRRMIDLQREYNSEDEAAIVELQLDLANVNRQILDEQDKGLKDQVKNTDRFTEKSKLQLQQMYEQRLIGKLTWQLLSLEMDAAFYEEEIAKAKAAGKDILELEKKLSDNRLKVRELTDPKKINKGMGKYTQMAPEEDNAEDAAFVDQLNAEKRRIRQFMGLEKTEPMEQEFAVFETNQFQAQFEKLEDWYSRGIFSYEEYERRKTDISREQNKFRMDVAQRSLQAISGLLGAMGQLYSAQKEKELKEAGNNQKKQDAIRKKYAKKEQAVSIGQAVIAGSMAIMQILSGKITGNPLIDSIIKAALITMTVATTGMQIKAIKTQQFAKGKYPVIGASDGKTYHAEVMKKAPTGLYDQPALIADGAPEMVIDYPTLKNIKMNAPGLLDTIMAMRVPQYAYGKYPTSKPSPVVATQGSAMEGGMTEALVSRFEKAVEDFGSKELVLSVKDVAEKLAKRELRERQSKL